MKLKRFSDFPIEEKNDIDDKEIDLEEKTGADTDIEEEKEQKLVSKNTKVKAKEEIDERFQIEILEDNIIKFNDGNINKIYELLSEKYSDTHYFIRKKTDQLHIVKYAESLTLNVNGFVDSLFKFYSEKKELKSISEGVKIKGNDKFSVIENINLNVIDKVVNDLSKLLSIKK